MKLDIKNQLAKLIDAYKENNTDYANRLKETLQQFNQEDVKKRYTSVGLKEIVEEAKAEIIDEWDKVCVVFNHKAKMIVADAKESLADAIMNPSSKPSDYAVKVNTALQFLQLEIDSKDKIAGEIITDDVAYSILKDFIDDYENMKLFRRVIENSGAVMLDYQGNSTFPKTFRKFENANSVLESFGELDEAVDKLFIHKKVDSDDTVYVGNQIHCVPIDGYEEIAGWDIVLGCSEEIEKIASEY